MTWREIKESVSQMPESELDRDALFVETLDEGCCQRLTICRATCAIKEAWGRHPDAENAPVVINPGEAYFW